MNVDKITTACTKQWIKRLHWTRRCFVKMLSLPDIIFFVGLAAFLGSICLVAFIAILFRCRMNGYPNGGHAASSLPQDSPRGYDAVFPETAEPLPPPPPQRDSKAGEKRQKMHCFLVLGSEYYQKTCKLSPHVVVDCLTLYNALQNLFAEEVLAHEAATGEELVPIAEMEIQYLDRASGQPVQVSQDTSIDAVLASRALLISHPPLCELISRGAGVADVLQPKALLSRAKAPRRLKGGVRAQRRLGSPNTPSRRLLTMMGMDGSPTSADGPDGNAELGLVEEDGIGNVEGESAQEVIESADEMVSIPADFFRRAKPYVARRG